MEKKKYIHQEDLENLMQMADIGWWKANFNEKTYTCSDFIVNLLGLTNEILPFYEFVNYIRPDYQTRLIYEFASLRYQNIYEQSFPVNTPFGEKWVHSRVCKRETDENGHLVCWGFMQTFDIPTPVRRQSSINQVSNPLYKQSSISTSLMDLLQRDDLSNTINKILQDILIQFHGGRVYIFEYNYQHETQDCVFEVLAEGVTPQQNRLQHVKLSDTPWWTEQLQAHIPVVMNTLDDFPAEAEKVKKILEEQDIKSIIVIPMISRNKVWGYLGIDIVDTQRTWQEEDYQWFSSLANIIMLYIDLRKSENEAQAEKEYLKNLYKYMPIAYMRMQLIYGYHHIPVDYRIIELNPAFEKVTGYTTAQFLGKTSSTCMDFPLKLSLKDLVEVSEKGEYKQGTSQNSAGNKYYRTILYSPEKDIVIALFSDLTDTVCAHKALDKSEKTLRKLFTNLPVGIETYDTNGFLIDCNDKEMEIFGLKSKEDALGVNLFNNPIIPQNIIRRLRNKEEINFDLKYDFSKLNQYYNTTEKGIKHLSIKARPLFDTNGNFENYLIIIIDNTETLTAHNKIRNFESLFSIIADFAKIGFFRWNPITQEGEAIGQWYKNMSEPDNKPLQEIFSEYAFLHPEDAEALRKGFNNLITGKESGCKLEIRVKEDDNRWKWLRYHLTVNKYDPDDDNVVIIGANYDITELKEIENALTEAKNKAEALDQLKSAFLANISHEIRTPLNAIIGFSSLLAETEDSAEKQEYVSIIEKNNDLLLQLISDILDLSRIESGNFDFVYEEVNIHEMCSEIVLSLSVKVPPAITLKMADFLPAYSMQTDKNRLTQVLSNFINNALKFTHTGSITINYELRKGKKEIEFSVTDTGIGIPRNKQEHIFDRFVKLNTFVQGTGLGLSICKSIIEQMGGTIGVTSEEGEGSRFWFVLPLTDQGEKESGNILPEFSETSGDATESRRKKPTILIAEDTNSNFLLLSTILKKDYRILRALNGDEAVEMYRSENPVLILMDIKMPVTDGLTATQEIRNMDVFIPIIAISAFAFNYDKEAAIDAGCTDYLSKPINPILLKNMLKKYIPE